MKEARMYCLQLTNRSKLGIVGVRVGDYSPVASAVLAIITPANRPKRPKERTMNDAKREERGAPKVVDRNTFQAELDALRVREKAHTREGDAIAAARRRLPMVEVDGATPLT